jgi:hypothetical protein
LESEANPKVERIPFEPIKRKKKSASSSQIGKEPVGKAKSEKEKTGAKKTDSEKTGSGNTVKQEGNKQEARNSTSNNKLKFKPTTALTNRRQNQQTNSQAQNNKNNRQQNKINSSPIPKLVSDRMVRRSALFCGIPTGLGFSILIASYIVVSRHLFELPNTPVLLASLGLTGIGVLGLSYGALSASWDENRLGSWWGADEFQKNFGYLTAALKNQNDIQRSKNKSAEQKPNQKSEQDSD